MTVIHSIEFPLKIRGTESAEPAKKARDTAERLGIGEFVEPLGQTTNVQADADRQRFVVVADRVSAKIGDAVGVYAAPGHLRVVALNG